ncbi:MAG TPA: phosphonate ABC transporter, permease protein PhnE, partial [Oxalicibacterium sp.]|nr:phosphonate ABC transporter, permease protein PhnE [Oxalicibacterium sp.]
MKSELQAELKAGRILPPAPRMHWSNVLLLIGLIALVVASFATLPLKWQDFFSADAIRSSREFLHGFMPPELRPAFLTKIGIATF